MKIIVEMRSGMILSPFEEEFKLFWSDVQGLDALVMQGCSHSMASDLGASQVIGSWDMVFCEGCFTSILPMIQDVLSVLLPHSDPDTSFVPLCPEKDLRNAANSFWISKCQQAKQSQLPGSYLYQILTQKPHTPCEFLVALGKCCKTSFKFLNCPCQESYHYGKWDCPTP